MPTSLQEAEKTAFHGCLQGGEFHFCANKIIRGFPRAATPYWSRLGEKIKIKKEKLMAKEDKARIVMGREIFFKGIS